MTALTDEQMAVVEDHCGLHIHGGVFCACSAILSALSDPRLSRRDEWLEQAAKVCEATQAARHGRGINNGYNAIADCIDAIRAMKTERE